jgi:hypothetical protein
MSRNLGQSQTDKAPVAARISEACVLMLRLLVDGPVKLLTTIADGPYMSCYIGHEVVPRKWFGQMRDLALIERNDDRLDPARRFLGFAAYVITEKGLRVIAGGEASVAVVKASAHKPVTGGNGQTIDAALVEQREQERWEEVEAGDEAQEAA